MMTVGVAAATLAAGLSPSAASTTAGQQWRITNLVSLHRYGNLLGLVATAPNDAWAFGDGPKAPIAVHWNGAKWVGSTLPHMRARPEQVSATSPDNVWAAGSRCFEGPPDPDVNRTFLTRWNGHRWKTVTFSQAALCFGKVVTTGPKSGWILGDQAALQISGSKTRMISLAKFGQVEAATAVSADDVWAFTNVFSTRTSFALNWNGRHWVPTKLPKLALGKGGFLNFESAVAISRDNVWATALALPKRPFSVLLHWNGHAWSRVVVPSKSDLVNITTDGHGGLWVLAAPTGDLPYEFLHFSHGAWTTSQIPTAGLRGLVKGTASFDIFAIARIPGTTSVWATGLVSYEGPNESDHAATVTFKYGA